MSKYAQMRVEPTYVRKLLELCHGNTTVAGAKMQSHPSTVTRAIRDGAATASVESKARVAYEAEVNKTPAPLPADDVALVLCTVPANRNAAFRKFAQHMGIEIYED